MTSKNARLLQLLVLASLGGAIVYKFVSGTMYYYINDRFFLLVGFGAAGFLLLAGILLSTHWQADHDYDHGHDHDHDHDHEHTSGGFKWSLFFVALPVILAVFVPASPLGASAITTRGITNTAPITTEGQNDLFQLQVPPNNRTILDWVRFFNFTVDLQQYVGQPADVVGFVYFDPRLGEGQFSVLRYTLSCCVADAFAIAMVVNWDDVDELQPNSWVRVKGSVDIITLDDFNIPLIHAESIQVVEQPAQPYLLP